MALAGIELRYLAEEISRQTKDYYTSNIYGIDQNSVLFKLHHPDKPDILLVLSTMGIWTTSVRIQQIAENRLVSRLRSSLLRLKLKSVKQPGLERLAYLTFAGFDKEFVLVGEFFGDGNIILCNDSMKVLALQHSIDVRHRSLRVGVPYVAPPQTGANVLEADYSDYLGLRESGAASARWMGRNMGLPKRYAEGILGVAGVDPQKPGNLLDDTEIRSIYEAAIRLAGDIISGNHTPVISDGEAVPVNLGAADASPVDDYMSGLDYIFTRNIMEGGRESRSDESRGQVQALQNRLAEQEKAILTVQERSQAMTRVAESLYVMLSRGILRLDTQDARDALEQNGAALIREKGIPMLLIRDEKIRVDLEAPLQSTASVLYGESKRQSGAVKSIQAMMAKTRKQLERESGRARANEDSVTASKVRKRNWFERYRWFYTTDGCLAVGGRDAPSNSAVIRKHMESGDHIFHAQMFGSPFFVLKGDCRAASLEEAAQATVCFSRVWREAMYGASAYWVSPDQVKKSAPSGQYLPKGSFTIEGRRNFVRVSSMRLAVGIMEWEGDRLLVCGPVAPVSRHAGPHIVIGPSGNDTVSVAKKIREEFLGMELEGASLYGIDDYVRALPPGKSHIEGVNRGS